METIVRRLLTRAVVTGLAVFLMSALLPATPKARTSPLPVDLGTLGGMSIQPFAVNDSGMVVGVGDVPGLGDLPDVGNHGFVWTQASGMVDIGTLGGRYSNLQAVNKSGTAVGASSLPGDTQSHAIVWTQGSGMLDLGTLGGSVSGADAVNDSGMAVGVSYLQGDTAMHAFVWTQHGGMVDLGTLGGTNSAANGVNNKGMVIGYSQTPGDASTHAFIWTQESGMVDLGALNGGSSGPAAVNEDGMVVGGSDGRAFIWTQAGGMVELDGLEGSFAAALAVNDEGMVTGYWTTPEGDHRPFVWTHAGGTVDLGTLGGRSAGPAAINNSGTVVGWSNVPGDLTEHAFMWTQSGGMVDLGALPLGGSPLSSSANAVNDNGVVVGYSSPNSADASDHVTLWATQSDPYNTPSGSGVMVESGGVSLAFDNVSMAGITSVAPIDPASIGELPGGFAVSELLAYDVTTTASFTGSVTIGFTVPGPISETDFNGLIVLHNENGVLVDVTAATPPRDYATLSIYATTTSLSPFYLVRTNPRVAVLFDQSRAHKLKSAIPIKLQLLNSANVNVSARGTTVTVRDLRLVGGTEAVEVADAGNANPDRNFRYDSALGGTGGYIFNLSTKSLAAGRYILSFYVGSNHSFFHTVAFELK